MKGAMAELCAKRIRAPTSTSTRIIGVSHHHLLSQKNPRSSPTIPVRSTKLFNSRMRAPFLSRRGPAQCRVARPCSAIAYSAPDGTEPERPDLHHSSVPLLDQVVAEHQHVHPTSGERAERFRWR